jgi:hypothetical protein
MRRADRLWLAAALAIASTPAWLGVLRADDTAIDRLLQAMCRSPDGSGSFPGPRTVAGISSVPLQRSAASAPSP